MHTGQRATCSLAQPLGGSTPEERRQGALLGTAVGSLLCVALAWDEGAAATLRSLQHAIALHVAHPAGLNPAAFR